MEERAMTTYTADQGGCDVQARPGGLGRFAGRRALRDARGESVSTDSTRAVGLYEQALMQFHSYVGDPVATIDLALQEDGDFVLGHAFRATMLALLSEGRYLPAMRASVQAAESLADIANARERGFTAAARCWLDGDWAGACQTWERVLIDHPRDAFALQIDWYTSREPDWAPDNGFAFHNWFHLALYHLERGEHDRALQIYDRCIYPQPADMSLQMVDATAVLWRMHLYGVEAGERWQVLADQWQAKAEAENGYYAFNMAKVLSCP
jgi:tetratricopeptide (TPR) repeat protein